MDGIARLGRPPLSTVIAGIVIAATVIRSTALRTAMGIVEYTTVAVCQTGSCRLIPVAAPQQRHIGSGGIHFGSLCVSAAFFWIIDRKLR